MSQALEEMKSRIDSLPGIEQAELANYLLKKLKPADSGFVSSLDDNYSASPEELDRAWRQEIRRRLENLESGKSVGRPADEVFAELERDDP